MVDKKVLLNYGAYNMVEAVLEQARPQPNNQMGSLSLVVLRLLFASHVSCLMSNCVMAKPSRPMKDG